MKNRNTKFRIIVRTYRDGSTTYIVQKDYSLFRWVFLHDWVDMETCDSMIEAERALQWWQSKEFYEDKPVSIE